MKKILLLVAVVAAAFSLNAQRTVDLSTTLITPAANSTLQSYQAIPMQFTLTNLGPDSITTDDSLIFGQFASTSLITTANFKLTKVLAKDSSVTLTINTNGIQGGPTGTNPLDICAVVILVNRAEGVLDTSNFGNNRSCHTVTYTNTTSVSELSEYKLTANVYPNPVSTTATIDYILSSTQNVSVKIFDMAGRMVANVFEGKQEAGEQSVKFDVSSLENGIYFYQLNAGELSATNKIVVKK